MQSTDFLLYHTGIMVINSTDSLSLFMTQQVSQSSRILRPIIVYHTTGVTVLKNTDSPPLFITQQVSQSENTDNLSSFITQLVT